MDENVQLPQNLLLRVKRAAEVVDKATDVRIISHNDADGLAAAGILCSLCWRKCKPFQCSNVKGFDEQLVRESAKACDLLIIADMGSNNLEVLESLGIPVIVLDHHRPERDSDKVFHLNPHRFGVDGAVAGCASSLAMLLAVTVSENNWDLLWVAFAGIVGDRQHLRGLQGINAWLYQNGVTKRQVEERPGQLICDGSLRHALYESSEPFIRGVSGDRKGVEVLLDAAGVPEDLPYESLDRGQQMKLNSVIMLYLLKQGVGMSSLEELLANRYYSPDKKLYSKDVANALNACGKSEEASLGVAAMLGDGESLKKAWSRKDEFGETLLRNSLEADKKGLKQMEHIQYFSTDQQEVGSEVCSVMMQWVADQNKPTISISIKNGEARVSSRANRHIVDDLGVDLGAALKEASRAAGGNGGGHNIASGGRIPMGKEEMFLQELDHIIGRQKAAVALNGSK